MKINRYGRARVLTSEELNILLQEIPEGSHRVLAHLLRRTSARVSEGLQLKWGYINDRSIVFPALITKRAKKSREVPLHPDLKIIFHSWEADFNQPVKAMDWVFPGQTPGEHLTRQSVDYVLRKSTKACGFNDLSSHSFRRSALTAASAKNILLRDFMEPSGRSDLGTLQRYLEVSPEAKKRAALAFA